MRVPEEGLVRVSGCRHSGGWSFKDGTWSPDWRVLIRRRTRGLWRQSPFYGHRAYGVTSASTSLLPPPPKHSALAPNTPFPCPRNGYFLVRTEKRPVLCPSRADSAEARFGMYKGDNVHQLRELSLIKHRVLDLVHKKSAPWGEGRSSGQYLCNLLSLTINYTLITFGFVVGMAFRILREPAPQYPFLLKKHLVDAPEAGKRKRSKYCRNNHILDQERGNGTGKPNHKKYPPAAPSHFVFKLNDQGMKYTYSQKDCCPYKYSAEVHTIQNLSAAKFSRILQLFQNDRCRN